MSDKKLRHHKGFALLEVLVALGILAIGILALTKFQGGALRSGSDAKARTVATNLAQERMELLRNFNDAAAYDAIVNGADPDNPIELSGTEFDVSWTTEDYYFTAPNEKPTTERPLPTSRPDFKRITVTVSWTDESDEDQEINLQSFINANPPTDSGRVNAPPPSSGKPVATHTPGQAPEIVSIDHGGESGTKQETTTPQPDTIRQSGNTLVRFEEVTFSDDGEPKVLRRDDNLTLNCVCVQGRADSQEGLAPTMFDGSKGRYIVGNPVTNKQVGHAATGTETVGGEKLNLSSQPKVCDICCRDHHDHTDAASSYDPFRSAGDRMGDGDHNHYFPDSAGVLQLANNNNSLYLEACRMVRVEGIWRVVPDWRLESLQVLPSEFLQTNIDDYRNYVRQFVKEYIKQITTTSSYPQITPNPTEFTSSDYTAALENLPNSEEVGDELLLSTTSASQQEKQLLVFGLYIDYMDNALIEKLQILITNGDESFLEAVPFHLVNVTRLANWSTSSDAVSVSDQPIADGKETTYSRGLITAANPGNATVTATMERSNTGFTDTRSIDSEDEVFSSDSLNVLVDSGTSTTPGIIVSGRINIPRNVTRNPSDIRVVGSNGAFCTKPTDETYSCILDSTSVNNTITVYNYNYLTIGNCGSGEKAPVVFDNELSPTGAMIYEDATLNEHTSYEFNGMEVTEDQLLDISVNKGAGPGSC